jgi:hypothetical protein
VTKIVCLFLLTLGIAQVSGANDVTEKCFATPAVRGSRASIAQIRFSPKAVWVKWDIAEKGRYNEQNDQFSKIISMNEKATEISVTLSGRSDSQFEATITITNTIVEFKGNGQRNTFQVLQCPQVNL